MCGIDHCDAGALLAGTWGFSEIMQICMVEHHGNHRSHAGSPLGLTQIACWMADWLGYPEVTLRNFEAPPLLSQRVLESPQIEPARMLDLIKQHTAIWCPEPFHWHQYVALRTGFWALRSSGNLQFGHDRTSTQSCRCLIRYRSDRRSLSRSAPVRGYRGVRLRWGRSLSPSLWQPVWSSPQSAGGRPVPPARRFGSYLSDGIYA